MPNITRSALDALSLTNFPNNTSQLISPADLRDWLDNGIDSFVTQKDVSRLENVIYENEGSALAAAATVNLALATGNYLHITGAFNGITSFGNVPAGGRFVLVFDGICTLTDSATLILPGGSDITTAAEDCAMLVSEGSGNWRMVGFFPISGGGGGGDITAVTAGTGLSGGGTSGAVTLNLDNTAVTPAAYTNANITVDAQGRITAAASGSGGTGTVTSSGSPASGDLAKFTSATDITKAVSGTDYAPATSGTALLKGNGSGGFSSASAGTDYLAPPSGTAILKANSGGALANASAGTDYVAPGAATTSGLTMATSRLLGRTSAASPGAIEEITLTTTGTSGAATLTGGNLNIPQYSGGGGSGTVNSGTANRLTYYATTGTAVSELPTAGSAGQILQSNGTGSAPSWVAAPAATLTIGSSIVSGATAGRLLLTTTSGANQVLNQDSLLNYDTTNDRLGIGVASPAARLDLAAPVAANPSLILAPSSGVTPTGTTNGSIWCDTTSSNTSLTMRKDSAYTKILTLDRNPDFAGGTAGIVQSDANGTLTKGADLTALGIYAQTNSITAITTGSGSLIGTVTGITTLPANFFGVGKTIETKFSGLITMPNGSPVCTIDFRLTDGTTTSTLGSLVYDGSNMSGKAYMADCQLTCRTTGAGATFGISGQIIVNHAPRSQETVFITPASVAISGLLTTASALTLQVVVTWTGSSGGSIDTRTHFCNYIN